MKHPILLFLAFFSFTILAHANEFYYQIEEYDPDERVLTLTDGSEWKIGWWYGNLVKGWESTSPLKVYHTFGPANSNNIEFEHAETHEKAYGMMKKGPYTNERIEKLSLGSRRVILNSGIEFSHRTLLPKELAVGDEIMIFHDMKGYTLWNLSKKKIFSGFVFEGIQSPPEAISYTLKGGQNVGVPTVPSEPSEEFSIPFDVALNLETRLNERVLNQPVATQAVYSAILNYTAGLKDPKTPIKVFLFLGPTGVGKTELAKTLAKELYRDPNALIRFEMSHFWEPHSLTRLLGSPPGYVNHEEGGQLTEALRKYPHSVVLLDEIEKADAAVQKVFLPVFDEGYITDSKSREISCKEVIFIMTSNICSQEINDYFHRGYSAEQILREIEPILMRELSPELYNRTEPIIFFPLGEEVMGDLVDMRLKEVIRLLRETKKVSLTVDESAKKFLIKHGYHPALGARPLMHLIQKKVISSLSYVFVKEGILEGSGVTLFYHEAKDSWSVEVRSKG